MIIEFNGKEHVVKFNFGFIRTLDEKYKFEQNGIEMGFGVNMAYTMLDQLQHGALLDVIHAGTELSKKDAEQFIENYAEEHGDLEPLFNELKEEMGKSGMLKATLKKFQKQMNDQESN